MLPITLKNIYAKNTQSIIKKK